MKNLIKISITSLGTLAILGTSALAAAGTVNAPSGLVLREEASKTANPLTTVPDKAEVDIIEKNGEWYKVNYNSQEGYLFAEYVSANEEVKTPEQETPETTEPGEKTTTEKPNTVQAVNKLKVYNMPLITSSVISEIDTNVQITIIKQITNWSYVSAGDIQGWVRTYGIQNPVQPEAPEQDVEPTPETNQAPENETETQPEAPAEPTEPTVSEPETTTPEESEEETTTSHNPSNSAQTEGAATATKGYVAVDSATVRAEATTNSEVVTYLIEGTSFDIKAETEEWYKIEYEDIEGKIYKGYIYKSLVTI